MITMNLHNVTAIEQLPVLTHISPVDGKPFYTSVFRFRAGRETIEVTLFSSDWTVLQGKNTDDFVSSSLEASHV